MAVLVDTVGAGAGNVYDIQEVPEYDFTESLIPKVVMGNGLTVLVYDGPDHLEAFVKHVVDHATEFELDRVLDQLHDLGNLPTVKMVVLYAQSHSSHGHYIDNKWVTDSHNMDPDVIPWHRFWIPGTGSYLGQGDPMSSGWISKELEAFVKRYLPVKPDILDKLKLSGLIKDYTIYRASVPDIENYVLPKGERPADAPSHF